MHKVDYKDDTDKDRYSSNGYKKFYTNIAWHLFMLYNFCAGYWNLGRKKRKVQNYM